MSFEGLWHKYDSEYGASHSATSSEEEGPTYCVYAGKFNIWAHELCVGATQSPSVVSINQSKVLLLDKYMEWRSFVPRRHRTYTGNAHRCIFHVFEVSYERLKVVELSLTPPMLFLPPPPPPLPSPPPPPQIAGVFIGELEDE